MPGKVARKEIFAINLCKKNISVNADLDLLSSITEGKSGADLELICRNAVMNLIRNNISAGKLEVLNLALFERDLVDAVRSFELQRNKRS